MSTDRTPDDDADVNDSLKATGNTPWVAAHVLANFEFSPRAGWITYEFHREDDGEERDRERSPRLDWLPDYDEPIINEELHRRWDELWRVANWAIWWALLCTVLFFAYDRSLGICLSTPLAVTVYWLAMQVPAIRKLDRRRRAAASADGKLTVADLRQCTEVRVVNWWELRKAGFSFVKPQDKYEDPAWRLVGRPFAILQYQSLRIPVIRKHRGKHELHTQNCVRIAATCHLIEVGEKGAQSPFGILLFSDSYDVYVVPNSPRNRFLFYNALQAARELILKGRAGDLPDEPTGNQCCNCPFGLPLVYKPGKTDAHLTILPATLKRVRGVDGREYHSICGDRFQWVPPHIKAKEKGLRDDG